MNEDQNKVDPMWDNCWQSGYNSRQKEVDELEYANKFVWAANKEMNQEIDSLKAEIETREKLTRKDKEQKSKWFAENQRLKAELDKAKNKIIEVNSELYFSNNYNEFKEALEQCVARINPKSKDTWDLKAIYAANQVLKPSPPKE